MLRSGATARPTTRATAAAPIPSLTGPTSSSTRLLLRASVMSPVAASSFPRRSRTR
ncbi:hypothetical protein BN1708_020626 [Verticillium longisporum]|uniref:Uncharacterized protein n=1 Tax=Verticillium longisporum TaxID=100787 RepID=A0A0G4MZF2_VERLO|nr:hypothetical protein BN1708_020626 [Verticillium longisporum]